jgi:biotin carboxylase
MKKALILGAGVYQLPLIRKAKEMGFFALVASTAGNYPGFSIADKPCYVDTTDSESIVRLAREENIDCVCTTGTDVAMRTLGTVCDALGLPGITESTGVLVTNKREMKQNFETGGVCTARYREVESLEQLQTVFALFGKPMICKAVDTSGSRGIIRVESPDQLPGAYKYVMNATHKNYFIVEEFIRGIEFGAQAAVFEGEVQFIMTHGDIVYHGKTDVPIGHYVPYSIPPVVEAEARRQIELSVRALGLSTCAINVDFILSDDQVYVLEIGARAGGTCLPELVSIHYDIDYYAYIVELSLGSKPRVEFVPKNACGNLLITSDQGGVLGSIEVDGDGLDIVETAFDYQPGDMIPAFRLGPDRLGHVVLKASDEDAVLSDLNQLGQRIRINFQKALEPGMEKTF